MLRARLCRTCAFIYFISVSRFNRLVYVFWCRSNYVRSQSAKTPETADQRRPTDHSRDCDGIEASIGPEPDPFMEAISIHGLVFMLQALRVIVFGGCATPPRGEWLRTGLVFRESEKDMAYGLRAPRNGTRGLLSALQAYILKYLLFERKNERKMSAEE